MTINYDYEDIQERLDAVIIYDTEFPIIRSRKRFKRDTCIPESARYVLAVMKYKVKLKLCKPNKHNPKYYWQVTGNKAVMDMFIDLVGAI